MSKLQDVFNKMEEFKREQKEIKDAYKDALVNSMEYQKIVEEIRELKEKKKAIEESVKAEFGNDYIRLEELKDEINNNKELMSDLALNQLMSGNTVEIKDQYENDYEPVFSVRFKKI